MQILDFIFSYSSGGRVVSVHFKNLQVIVTSPCFCILKWQCHEIFGDFLLLKMFDLGPI